MPGRTVNRAAGSTVAKAARREPSDSTTSADPTMICTGTAILAASAEIFAIMPVSVQARFAAAPPSVSSITCSRCSSVRRHAERLPNTPSAPSRVPWEASMT